MSVIIHCKVKYRQHIEKEFLKPDCATYQLDFLFFLLTSISYKYHSRKRVLVYKKDGFISFQVYCKHQASAFTVILIKNF